MSTNDISLELSQTVLGEIRAQFKRLKWQCDRWQLAEWLLTLEEYTDLWRSRWRYRRQDNLVLLRVDEDKPYEMGNVFIDTRTNQVKRMWENHRGNKERSAQAEREADERVLARKKLR
jgi:hypothetical protein